MFVCSGCLKSCCFLTGHLIIEVEALHQKSVSEGLPMSCFLVPAHFWASLGEKKTLKQIWDFDCLLKLSQKLKYSPCDTICVSHSYLNTLNSLNLWPFSAWFWSQYKAPCISLTVYYTVYSPFLYWVGPDLAPKAAWSLGMNKLMETFLTDCWHDASCCRGRRLLVLVMYVEQLWSRGFPFLSTPD